MIWMVIFRLAPDGFISFHASHYCDEDEQNFRCVCARWSQSRFFFSFALFSHTKIDWNVGHFHSVARKFFIFYFQWKVKSSRAENCIWIIERKVSICVDREIYLHFCNCHHCQKWLPIYVSFPIYIFLQMTKHFWNENCRLSCSSLSQQSSMTQHGKSEVRE